MAVPVPFIQASGDKFHVTDEARALLGKVRGKLAIVCVAGPYRTGKSFLLNTLVGSQSGKRESSGFQVGGSVRACTKGIWLWGEPVKKGDSTYIFMDSEGLGSTDQHITFDTQILSLAILLSSFFILNTQGTITEQTLAELELVVKCSERIRLTEEKSGGELGDIFPDFLWVLRDFALQLQDENENPITAKEYLETCLRPKAGAPPEKNRIRDAIKKVFKNRDCRTLVRPITEEDKLQKLPTMPWTSLRPEFRSQVESLCNLVYASAQPKQVEGGLVNGPAVIGLAEAYVQALNTGKMPVIHTVWQSVVMQQSAQALEAALQVYEECFKRLFANGPVDQERMHQEFREADENAFAKLKALSVGDSAQLQEQINRLNAKATELQKTRAEMNQLQSKDLCQKLLDEIWTHSHLEGKDFHSAAEFEAAMQDVKDQYYKQARGPSKDEVARVFFDKKQLMVARGLFAQLQQLHVVHAELLEEKKAVDAKLQATIQQAEASQKHYQQMSESAQNQFQQTLEAKETKLESLQTKLQTLQETSHKSELEHQAREHSLEKEKHNLGVKLETLNQTKEALESNYEQQAKELNKQLKELEVTLQSRAVLERESEQRAREIKELNHMLEAAQKSLVATEKQSELRIQDLQLQLANAQKAHGGLEKDANKRIHDLQTKLENTQKSLRDTQEQMQGFQKDSENREQELMSMLEEMKRQLQKLQMSESSSQKTILELQEYRNSLVSELSQVRSTGDNQSKEFRKTIDDLLEQQKQLSSDLAQAQVAFNAKGEELAMLSNQKVSIEQDHRTLLTELDKARGLGEAKVEEVFSMQRTIQELQESQKRLTADLTKTRNVIDTQNEELATLRNQKASVEQTLQGVKGQYDTICIELERARTAEAKAMRLEQQITKLHEEKNEQFTSFERQISTIEQEKTELSSKLATKIREQEVALFNEKSQYEKMLSKKLKDLEKQHQADLKNEDQRITELEQKVEELQRIKEERDETVVRKLIQIGELEKELSHAQSEFAHMSEINREVEQLTAEKRLLLNENATLKATINALTQTVVPPQSEAKEKSSDRGVRIVVDDAPPEAVDPESEEDREPDDVWKRRAAKVEERRKRQSIAPAPTLKVKNPEKCTVQELMSWLTSMDVELPPVKQKKQYYLDLLYKTEPELRSQSRA